MKEIVFSKSTLAAVCFCIIEIAAAGGFLLFVGAAVFTNVNLGNIVGAVMSAAVFAVCIKREFFCELLASLMANKFGRLAVTAFAVLVIIGIITAAVISVFMIGAMEHLPDEPAPVIILGCNVKESGPSLMLHRRIEAAFEYLSENETAVCIASGGQGPDEPMSEAQAIRDELVKMGIAPDRIILEDQSVNTFQNIRNSLEIMDELGLERRAVIVTSEFHQLRASIIAGKQGLESYSKSSRTSLTLLPSFWIREWFGVLHEIIIGRK